MVNQLAKENGVGPNGFEKPGADEIREFWLDEAADRFGRNLSGPNSAEVQFVDMLALASDTFWETLQSVYYGGKYPHAQGLQLDNILALAGISRLPRQEATGEVTFYSELKGGNQEDVQIPRSFTVSTEGDAQNPPIPFVTTEPATLPAGETSVSGVPVRALGPLETGSELQAADLGSATNVGEDTITQLVDSKSGIGGVTNRYPTGTTGTRDDGSSYDFRSGRDRETDAELRARYENSPALGGVATLGSIEANIQNCGDGDIVQSVNVVEEVEGDDLRASGGPPPKAIRPTVSLKNDTEANREVVAQAIQDSRAGGIESYGEVAKRVEVDGDPYPSEQTMNTTDSYGNIRCRNGFDLATEAAVYVNAEVITLPDVPADYASLVSAKILSYIGGETSEGATVGGEAGIGDDIYADRIRGILLDDDIGGVREIETLGVGKSSGVTTAQNLTIANDEEAVTHPNWINITTTPGEVE